MEATEDIKAAKERLRLHRRIIEGKGPTRKTSLDRKIFNVRKAAKELSKLTGDSFLSLIPKTAYNKREIEGLVKTEPKPATKTKAERAKKPSRTERAAKRRQAHKDSLTPEEYAQWVEAQREKRANLAKTRAERETEKLTRQAENARLQQEREQRAIERNLALETKLDALIMSQRGTRHTTRESWLMAFVEGSRLIFAMHNYTIPPVIKISVGFPHVGARGTRLGECWSEEKAGEYQIFVSPLMDNPEDVCAAVTHELAHTVSGFNHRKTFAKTVYDLGLEGKPRATVAGDLWREIHRELIQSLGPFPHRKLTVVAGRKKDGVRNHKIECPECGFPFRTTRKWYAEKTELQCPDIACGATIKLDVPDEPEPDEEESAAVEDAPAFVVSK